MRLRRLPALLSAFALVAIAVPTVALRGVPDGKVFDLYDAPSGTLVGQATSEQLQAGLRVDVPDKDGAKVLLVQPAG